MLNKFNKGRGIQKAYIKALDGPTSAPTGCSRPPSIQGEIGLPHMQVSDNHSHTFSALIHTTNTANRVRKVKCDEGRPACNKCVSTGRKCDGYGIWGGGGSAHTHHTSGRIALRPNPFPLFVNAAGEEEHCSFEWFRCRASKKIPGPFQSMFWDRIVLGACFDEPAVLHAVLAVGIAHKTESSKGDWTLPSTEAPDREEKFILKQYSMAIRHLQPHFEHKSVASVRVALISCMLFVCLEFLRGRYQTGNQHLANGIRLLGDLAGQADPINLEALQEPSDRWLMETFAKLNLQANLIGQGTRMKYNVVREFEYLHKPVIFHSMEDARKRLDWLQHETLRITALWHEQRSDQGLNRPDDNLLKQQLEILDQLDVWKRTLTISRVSIVTQMGHLGDSAFCMMRLYHSMAFIMCSAVFRPAGETTFDDYNTDFKQHMEYAIGMANAYAKMVEKVPALRNEHTGAPFTTSKGIIPPLYFAAIHCRIPRIRWQAIKFLRETAGREGIWDGPIAGTVAAEVARLEEGNFFDDLELGGFRDTTPITDDDLVVPALPESHRIHNVRVSLPNGYREPTVIHCKRWTSDNVQETIVRTYDPTSGEWTDANTT